MPKYTGKKRAKRKERNQLIVIFTTLFLISIYVIYLIADSIPKTKYEYYLQNLFGISDNCYEEEGQCYCEINNVITKVEQFYEVEK